MNKLIFTRKNVMKSKLMGTIIIPKNAYKGTGKAVLFIKKNDGSGLKQGNKLVCDKVLYLYEEESVELDLNSDEYHYPMKVLMSCWEACIPSLRVHYNLIES